MPTTDGDTPTREYMNVGPKEGHHACCEALSSWTGMLWAPIAERTSLLARTRDAKSASFRYSLQHRMSRKGYHTVRNPRDECICTGTKVRPRCDPVSCKTKQKYTHSCEISMSRMRMEMPVPLVPSHTRPTSGASSGACNARRWREMPQVNALVDRLAKRRA